MVSVSGTLKRSFIIALISRSVLWGVVGCACNVSDLDVFCFWICGVSGLSSNSVVGQSFLRSIFNSSSVLVSSEVDLVYCLFLLQFLSGPGNSLLGLF